MKLIFLLTLVELIAPIHACAAGSREAPCAPDRVTVTLSTEATQPPPPISVRAKRIVVGEGRNGTFGISIDVTFRNLSEYSIWSRGFSESASCCCLEKWSEGNAEWKKIAFVYRPEGPREIEAGAEQRFQLYFSESEFGPDTRVVFEYYDDPEFKSGNRFEAPLPQLQVDDDSIETVSLPVKQ